MESKYPPAVMLIDSKASLQNLLTMLPISNVFKFNLHQSPMLFAFDYSENSRQVPLGRWKLLNRIIVDQIGLTTRQKSANYEKNDIRDELMFAKRLMFKIFPHHDRWNYSYL